MSCILSLFIGLISILPFAAVCSFWFSFGFKFVGKEIKIELETVKGCMRCRANYLLHKSQIVVICYGSSVK